MIILFGEMFSTYSGCSRIKFIALQTFLKRTAQIALVFFGNEKDLTLFSEFFVFLLLLLLQFITAHIVYVRVDDSNLPANLFIVYNKYILTLSNNTTVLANAALKLIL